MAEGSSEFYREHDEKKPKELTPAERQAYAIKMSKESRAKKLYADQLAEAQQLYADVAIEETLIGNALQANEDQVPLDPEHEPAPIQREPL